MHAPGGQDDAHRTACGSYQQSLGEGLAHQAGARGAQRQPHGDLLLPRRSPRQQQVRHIGARSQQYQPDQRQQNAERLAEVFPQH